MGRPVSKREIVFLMAAGIATAFFHLRTVILPTTF
jgi:hypothetical protein